MTFFAARGAIGSFVALMPSTVTVFPIKPGSRTAFGVASFSTAGTKHRAHLQPVSARERNTEGISADTRSILWVATTSTSAIGTNSRIVLPDGSTPPIRDVTYGRDEYGVHHAKVYLG